MKLNFKNLKLKTLSGEPLNIEFHKVLANAIYINIRNLRYLNLAQKIYEGNEIELNNDELDAIEQVVNDERSGFAAFVRQAFKDFIKRE